MDAEVAALLSGLDAIFMFQEELRAFLSVQYVFASLPTGFGKSLLKHRAAWWLTMASVGLAPGGHLNQ